MTIKKKIILFMCMMITIIMTSTMAFAVTKNECGQVNRSTYNESYTGSTSNFCARAYGTSVYSTIQNTSSTSKYLTCHVHEYIANIGWGEQVYTSKNAMPGIQINAVYYGRDTEMVGLYYHSGASYVNSSCSYAYDTYAYSAYQWMTPKS